MPGGAESSGCSFVSGAWGGQDAGVVGQRADEPVIVHFEVVENEDGSSVPVASMTYGSSTLEGYGGSYCWSEGNAEMCADFAEWFDPDHSIQLPPDRPIVFEGSKNIQAGIWPQEYPSAFHQHKKHDKTQRGPGPQPNERDGFRFSIRENSCDSWLII